MEEKKEIKIYIKIENKEEIEEWINELSSKLKKANSSESELAKEVKIALSIDGKPI